MYFYYELICFLIFSTVFRLGLSLTRFSEVDKSLFSLFKSFSFGCLMDLVTATFISLIVLVFYSVFPLKLQRSKILSTFASWLFFSLFLFSLVAEYLFWSEYGTRFNFIAIDYLIYTTEVIDNIKQSYPLTLIFSGIGLGALALALLKNFIIHKFNWPALKWSRKKLWTHLGLSNLALFLFWSFNGIEQRNHYNSELSKNGIYSLFQAFWNNQINYEHFYFSLPENQVWDKLKSQYKNRKDISIVSDQNSPFTVLLTPQLKLSDLSSRRPKNVLLITVESLSAKFLGSWGNTQHNTPHLDKLYNESLVLTHLYASGTRTDRGMEALTTSLPPTPGRSILKRPHNEGLETIGEILTQRGYDSKFIYGGYGYFDNMNYFFGNNGFSIVDKGNFSNEEIRFSNAWGVCDQDLFDKVLKESDLSYSQSKPFFSFVMTTSNHRPYTYPEGVVNFPSGEDRRGAIMYTDYAIGEFIEKAKSKPWFKDTLFVIVADHCATSAGRMSLPPTDYEIPAFFYAPESIKPQKFSKMTAQIDIAPTILDILGIPAQSHFYGQSIFSPEFKERAFIGTYQKLGYIEDDALVVLSPQKKVDIFKFENHKDDLDLLGDSEKGRSVLEKAVSSYQSASYLFKHKQLGKSSQSAEVTAKSLRSLSR